MCQASPNEMIRRGAKLVLQSFCVAGLLPNMWQMELTLQVTWCRSIMRARPAHTQKGSSNNHRQGRGGTGPEDCINGPVAEKTPDEVILR